MPILVARATKEPAVPSTIVQCGICGADCWLSRYSGAQSIQLAEALGAAGIICTECYGV